MNKDKREVEEQANILLKHKKLNKVHVHNGGRITLLEQNGEIKNKNNRTGIIDKSQDTEGSGPRGFLSNNKNLGHVPCKFFKQGNCQAGNSCPFLHETEKSMKSEKMICKYFQKGTCRFGNKCALEHSISEGINKTNIKNVIGHRHLKEGLNSYNEVNEIQDINKEREYEVGEIEENHIYRNGIDLKMNGGTFRNSLFPNSIAKSNTTGPKVHNGNNLNFNTNINNRTGVGVNGNTLGKNYHKNQVFFNTKDYNNGNDQNALFMNDTPQLFIMNSGTDVANNNNPNHHSCFSPKVNKVVVQLNNNKSLRCDNDSYLSLLNSRNTQFFFSGSLNTSPETNNSNDLIFFSNHSSFNQSPVMSNNGSQKNNLHISQNSRPFTLSSIPDSNQLVLNQPPNNQISCKLYNEDFQKIEMDFDVFEEDYVPRSLSHLVLSPKELQNRDSRSQSGTLFVKANNSFS